MSKISELIDKTFTGTRQGIEDVVVSMVPQATSVVTGFITAVLIARGLGPKGMGNYALILSVSGLAATLSDLGIGQTAIRFAARAAEKGNSVEQLAILRWAFRLRILLVIAISTVAFVLTPFVARKYWHDISLSHLVRLSLLTSIFNALAAIPTIYFQSLKKFRMNATVNAGQAVVSLVGVVLLAVFQKWSLEMVVLVTVISAGVGAAAFALLVPHQSFAKLEEIRQPLKKLFLAPKPQQELGATLDATGANEFAFFMLLSSVAVTVTMRLDVWMMGAFLDKAAVGLYSVASRYTLPLVIVLGALNTALWPRASGLTDLSRVSRMISKTFRLSLLVAAAGLCYSFLAPMTIPAIFGASYDKGILIGQLLCLRYCIAMLTCPMGVIGYSVGLVKVYWWINLVQLAVVVIVNLTLLPQVGAIGAALALIANEVVGFTLAGFIIWRRISDLRAA